LLCSVLTLFILALQALLKEAEGKQLLLETLEKRVNNMQTELEPGEQQLLESGLKTLATELSELGSKIKSEIDHVADGVEARKKFEADLESVHAWLKAKNAEAKKYAGYLPLKAVAVEKEIQQYKVHVRFEVIMAVTMKNVDFWDIKPSSYFTGDTLPLHYRVQPVNAM
jgi:DNA repair exonuclease SbcCD ATPase subunit